MPECPFCGNKAPDKAISCSHCGKQICEIVRERRTRFSEKKNYVLFAAVLVIVVLALLFLLEAKKSFVSKEGVEVELYDLCVKECNKLVGSRQEYSERCVVTCKQMWGER